MTKKLDQKDLAAAAKAHLDKKSDPTATPKVHPNEPAVDIVKRFQAAHAQVKPIDMSKGMPEQMTIPGLDMTKPQVRTEAGTPTGGSITAGKVQVEPTLSPKKYGPQSRDGRALFNDLVDQGEDPIALRAELTPLDERRAHAAPPTREDAENRTVTDAPLISKGAIDRTMKSTGLAEEPAAKKLLDESGFPQKTAKARPAPAPAAEPDPSTFASLSDHFGKLLEGHSALMDGFHAMMKHLSPEAEKTQIADDNE